MNPYTLNFKSYVDEIEWVSQRIELVKWIILGISMFLLVDAFMGYSDSKHEDPTIAYILRGIGVFVMFVITAILFCWKAKGYSNEKKELLKVSEEEGSWNQTI